MINVRIQQADFEAELEKGLLRRRSFHVGAVVEFTGIVRANDKLTGFRAIFLEHYPLMTEKAIKEIVEAAMVRWHLIAVTVIHRVGELAVGENIVFVGVASSHRLDAIQAVEFIMDYLKSDVPIWKKEIFCSSEQWVVQKQADIDAKNTWILSE